MEDLSQLNICLHTLVSSLQLSTAALSLFVWGFFAVSLRRALLTASPCTSPLVAGENESSSLGLFSLLSPSPCCARLSWPFRKSAHDESETQRTPASTQR